MSSRDGAVTDLPPARILQRHDGTLRPLVVVVLVLTNVALSSIVSEHRLASS
jgi:hypothetical protein